MNKWLEINEQPIQGQIISVQAIPNYLCRRRRLEMLNK